MTSVPTTIADWQQQCGNMYDYILDEDIQNAYAEATLVFNPNITATDAQFTLIFLYLAAHFLVCDLRAKGLQTDTQGLITSKAVGNVSVNYTIPAWMQKQGLSFYTSTYYGYKWLSLMRIYIVGNVTTIRGNGPYNVASWC